MGVRTDFFCFGGGVLLKFLLDDSSFSAPPPLRCDIYCTVPYESEDFSDAPSITFSKPKILGFPFCKKNSLTWAVKCEN